MTVPGCAPVNVGGIVACGARHLSGSFIKIAKYDQIESAVCDLDSTLSRYALVVRVMGDTGADLRVALAEADTFHLVSPLQRRSGWLQQWSTVVAAALITAIVVTSAESAVAADLMATKAPPIPTAYDWTGFYAGGYLGYAWGNSNGRQPPTSPAP